MTIVDRLSDTVYRDQAREQLDALLRELQGYLQENYRFPVKRTQLYGLRQIARQQPKQVKNFARHQRERAERKHEGASERAKPSLESEIKFWKLVESLCDSHTDWSVHVEGARHAPPELREENIPPRRPGMTDAERRDRNQLRQRLREWNDRWEKTHVPAFFERFCTHALYRLKMSEKNHGIEQNE